MVHDKKDSSHAVGWRVTEWHSTGNEEIEIRLQRFVYTKSLLHTSDDQKKRRWEGDSLSIGNDQVYVTLLSMHS